MAGFSVSKEFNAPIDTVFAILEDHEGLIKMPGVDRATLIKEGHPSRNGVGAIREVKIGPVTVQEEILKFEPNALIEYRVIKAKPKIMRHDYGRQVFEELPGQRCRVTWSTKFEITIPLIGKLLSPFLSKQFSKSFYDMLVVAEELAIKASQSSAKPKAESEPA